MRGIGTLLAPEIDFGIAVGFGVAGHGVGLSWGLGRLVVGCGIRGRRIARPFVVRRSSLSLGLETLVWLPPVMQEVSDPCCE